MGESAMFRILNLIPSREDSLENGNKRFWSDVRKRRTRRRRRDQVGPIEMGGRNQLCYPRTWQKSSRSSYLRKLEESLIKVTFYKGVSRVKRSKKAWYRSLRLATKGAVASPRSANKREGESVGTRWKTACSGSLTGAILWSSVEEPSQPSAT